ncbi:hypothetical protein Agub_g11765, partial [Astrephomene gubernaculifera]
WPRVASLVRSHRLHLSLTSTTLLAFVVWQTLSAARDTLLAQRPGPVFAMMGLAVAMHVAYLGANYLVVWHVLRAPLREAIATVIMASQKSAPVAVTTITFLTRDPAQQGLLSLPAIVGQLCQIFIGAALAPWLAGVVARSELPKELALSTAASAAVRAESPQQQQEGSAGKGRAGSHHGRQPEGQLLQAAEEGRAGGDAGGGGSGSVKAVKAADVGGTAAVERLLPSSPCRVAAAAVGVSSNTTTTTTTSSSSSSGERSSSEKASAAAPVAKEPG